MGLDFDLEDEREEELWVIGNKLGVYGAIEMDVPTGYSRN